MGDFISDLKDNEWDDISIKRVLSQMRYRAPKGSKWWSLEMITVELINRVFQLKIFDSLPECLIPRSRGKARPIRLNPEGFISFIGKKDKMVYQENKEVGREIR